MLLKFNNTVERNLPIPHTWGAPSSLLIICFLSMMALSTNSQDIHNGNSIFIGGKAQLHAAGALRNPGFISNNGSLQVLGDLESSGVYQGQGTVELSGKSTQQLSFSNQTIERLIINSAGVTLHDKLNVMRSLILQNGHVKVGDDDTLFIKASATIDGGSEMGFIDGRLTLQGTGYKYLPLGKDSRFYPMEFSDVKGINPVFEVKLHENLSMPDLVGVNEVSTLYFVKKDLEGFFEKSAVGLPFDFQSETSEPILLFADELDAPFEMTTGSVAYDNAFGTPKLSTVSEITANIFATALYQAPPEVVNKFYVSTTLSPNATNPHNRFVKVFGDELQDSDFIFEVFDRWGKGVFSTKSLSRMSEEGWDGRNRSGEPLPVGVYPYVLKGIDRLGKVFLSKGAITIIK